MSVEKSVNSLHGKGSRSYVLPGILGAGLASFAMLLVGDQIGKNELKREFGSVADIDGDGYIDNSERQRVYDSLEREIPVSERDMYDYVELRKSGYEENKSP